MMVMVTPRVLVLCPPHSQAVGAHAPPRRGPPTADGGWLVVAPAMAVLSTVLAARAAAQPAAMAVRVAPHDVAVAVACVAALAAAALVGVVDAMTMR